MQEGEGTAGGAVSDAAHDAEAAEELTADRSPTSSTSWFRNPASDVPALATRNCPFLAIVDADGLAGSPLARPDASNSCVALGDPAPQSASQQQLVCLTAGHPNCPRYLRGVLIGRPVAAPPTREPVSAAVIASALILVASLAASFGFLAVRCGLSVALASAVPLASDVAIVPAASIIVEPIVSIGASAEAARSSAPEPSPTPSIVPTPTPSPEPTPTPTPTATPSPSPTPTPTATPPPTPRPSSNRYDVLTVCPSTPDCWVYVVRSGDNLASIAHYFGVSLDSIYALNPWARTTGLRAGQHLRITTPTR